MRVSPRSSALRIAHSVVMMPSFMLVLPIGQFNHRYFRIASHVIRIMVSREKVTTTRSNTNDILPAPNFSTCPYSRVRYDNQSGDLIEVARENESWVGDLIDRFISRMRDGTGLEDLIFDTKKDPASTSAGPLFVSVTTRRPTLRPSESRRQPCYSHR
jgi:hypothetical protein